MLRHHRLLETFLTQVLGYGWDEVHEEAERLEHVISERFEERIAEAVGHPTHDPHGDPIPDANLRMPPERDEVDLGSVGVGRGGTLTRVGTQDRENLTLLGRLGLVPGAEVLVVATGAGGVSIETRDGRHRLPRDLANRLWLKETS
jgi:DtxR family Mn-dependent transcriptional regulator